MKEIKTKAKVRYDNKISKNIEKEMAKEILKFNKLNPNLKIERYDNNTPVIC
jgi:hypothetical protein